MQNQTRTAEINKNQFHMKTKIQILLALVIVALGYLIIQSILEPVNFNKEAEKREREIIERLKTIRDAQVAHRLRYTAFNSDLDSLVRFIKTDSLQTVLAIGVPPEDMTEEEAIRQGIVKRIVTWNSVMSQVFAGKAFPPDSLPYVPFGKGARFSMGADKIERGLITVPVFEASTTPEIYMAGTKYKIYYSRMDGLRVGSLTEAHLNGNWE